jgi:hypothetical protein
LGPDAVVVGSFRIEIDEIPPVYPDDAQMVFILFANDNLECERTAIGTQAQTRDAPALLRSENAPLLS